MFNEASSFRSTIKATARNLVKEQYQLYPNANDPHAPAGFEGLKSYVKNRVNNDLLAGMAFLNGPPDERVSNLLRASTEY